MKNYKISVHIPLYLQKPYSKKKLKNFNKVCKSLLRLSNKSQIFVHTNQKLKSKNKKIKYFYYNFKKDHPFKLTWYCRNLMETQRTPIDFK